MCPRFLSTAFVLATLPALAGEIPAPQFTEAVQPVKDVLLGVAIGPGGPDVEFGRSEANGGLYRLGDWPGPVTLSDGLGLRNPTGLTTLDGIVYLVDGNQIVAISPAGTVLWRMVDPRDGAFFYDIEPGPEGRLLVGDFGNGRLIAVDPANGEIRDFAPGAQVPGLARFAIDDGVIWAISWGSDTAWDGALYRLSADETGWQAERFATGFGNAEAVAVHDGQILVGGYRGHKTAPRAKLLRVDAETGAVTPLEHGTKSQGVSDILIVDETLYLTHFRDHSISLLPLAVLE